MHNIAKPEIQKFCSYWQESKFYLLCMQQHYISCDLSAHTYMGNQAVSTLEKLINYTVVD